MSAQELELVRLQQETQAKYVAALNELQMLKIAREIAQTNQAIAAARLATVTAEKNTLLLLSPPPPAYAQGLVTPVSGTPSMSSPGYTVVSVSQLQNRWNAVLGYQDKLYSVSIGDVLPSDGSTVVSISRSGVVLEKDGAKRKISMVPII